VEARIEAATRQLKGGTVQSNSSTSFLGGPLSPQDEVLLSQLASYLQPPPADGLTGQRFDASELLGLRSGGVGADGAAVPALFEPVVLHEHSASSVKLVRQLLTPPPVVVELPVAIAAVADTRGTKGKAAASKDSKSVKAAKAQ